jgi:hypothetical protein
MNWVCLGVVGRQNGIEFAHHHVLAEESSVPDLGQIVALRRHLAQAVVPFFDNTIADNAHRRLFALSPSVSWGY